MTTRDEQLDILTAATQVNDEESRLTLYVIACPEHGGRVMPNAPAAIDAAMRANEGMTEAMQSPLAKAMGFEPCKYVAIAVGLDADLVAQLFAEPPGTA